MACQLSIKERGPALGFHLPTSRLASPGRGLSGARIVGWGELERFVSGLCGNTYLRDMAESDLQLFISLLLSMR